MTAVSRDVPSLNFRRVFCCGWLRGSRRSLDRYQAARSKAIHARPRTLEIGEHEGALAASGCTELHLLDGSCPMNDLTSAHLQRDTPGLGLRLPRHGRLGGREWGQGTLPLR